MGLFSICTSASDFAHLVHVTARLVIKPDGNKIHYTYGNGSNPTKEEWLVGVPAVCSGRHECCLYRYLADCSYCTSRRSEVGRECVGRIQEPALLKTQVGDLNLALPLFCKNDAVLGVRLRPPDSVGTKVESEDPAVWPWLRMRAFPVLLRAFSELGTFVSQRAMPKWVSLWSLEDRYYQSL
jgi:hypothetical protein